MVLLKFIAAMLSARLASVEAKPMSKLAQRQSSGTATVSLSNNTGAINHLASGIIFGVPDDAAQIPDNMYTDWGFNFLRAGGAALPEPRAGWAAGLSNYEERMQQVLGDYHAAQKFGAKFIFLFENIYGNWDVQNGPYPGDNNDWTSWDNMTQHVIADLKAANVDTSDFIIDIFNEMDGPWYWQRGETQAWQMWLRTYNALRTAFGSALQIQGPSHSAEPSLNNSWWTDFMQFVKDNNCVPDTWTWHMELGGSQNMLESTANFDALLAAYDLPKNNININEYATADEQVPAGGAWWISQLERVDAVGLRGNWQPYPNLYDYLANLVSKPGAPNASPTAGGYYPNGEYQVYKHYAQTMTGHRVGTMPTSDMVIDVYATHDPSARKVFILTGNRPRNLGSWTVQVNDLETLGLSASGTLQVDCLEFPDNTWWGEVDGPKSCGSKSYSYSGGVLNIDLDQQVAKSAYAFEFSY